MTERRPIRTAFAAVLSIPAIAHAAAPPSGPAKMPLDRAMQVVDGLTRRQAALSPDEPLRAPKSLEDVDAILRRDRIDLFGGAVHYALESEDSRAFALQGQIHLAWGEALLVLADLLNDAAARVRARARALEMRRAAGDLDADGRQALESLEKARDESARMAEALNIVGMQHMWAGGDIAREVVARRPDEYIGYRLAADYYRLRHDWLQFDRMIVKLTDLNPDSNGLVFLQGVSVLEREANVAGAQALFRKALERDPSFVRAQVALFLSYPFVGDAYDEYAKLKNANPRHQIVVFADSIITEAFEAARLQQKAGAAARPATAPSGRAATYTPAVGAPAVTSPAVPAVAPGK